MARGGVVLRDAADPRRLVDGRALHAGDPRRLARAAAAAGRRASAAGAGTKILTHNQANCRELSRIPANCRHVLAEELALFEQIPEMAAEQVPGIIQVTWLTVMGELYGRVAVRLNGWENHKTEVRFLAEI